MSYPCLQWRTGNLIAMNISVLVPLILCISLFISYIITINKNDIQTNSIVFSKKLLTTYAVTCVLFIISMLIFVIVIILEQTKYCDQLGFIVLPLATVWYHFGLCHMYLYFYYRLKIVFDNIPSLRLTNNQSQVLFGIYVGQMILMFTIYGVVIVIAYYILGYYIHMCTYTFSV